MSWRMQNGNYSLGAMNGTYTVSHYFISAFLCYGTDSASFTMNHEYRIRAVLIFVWRMPSGISPVSVIKVRCWIPFNFEWSFCSRANSREISLISICKIKLAVAIIDSSFKLDYPRYKQSTGIVSRSHWQHLSERIGWDCTLGNFCWWLENALVVNPAPSLLSGHIYYDANNNGAFDTGELPVSSQKVSMVPDNSYAFTDGNGDFLLGASLGSHTISLDVDFFSVCIVFSAQLFILLIPEVTRVVWFRIAFRFAGLQWHQSILSGIHAVQSVCDFFPVLHNTSNTVSQGYILYTVRM